MKNREIEFRGKTIDNEFEYGLLSRIQNNYYISNSYGKPFAFQVSIETIGQFTGLYDKDGVKVFEGDILEDGIVYFDEKYLGFFVKLGGKFQGPLFDIPLPKVLGNIHEHKEMIL